jgi:hypothetical protein
MVKQAQKLLIKIFLYLFPFICPFPYLQIPKRWPRLFPAQTQRCSTYLVIIPERDRPRRLHLGPVNFPSVCNIRQYIHLRICGQFFRTE